MLSIILNHQLRNLQIVALSSLLQLNRTCWLDLLNHNLSDERVVVDFDVDVDGSVGKCLKDLSEEGDARVLSPLTETLCTEKHKAETASVWTPRGARCRRVNSSMTHGPHQR